jgi:glycine/D-amino acid oxidase-like deaminating enzyme
MPRFPQLERDLHTDVLIIGGGLAGLLCAWNLTRAGVDCALIEQHRIMGGVSGRTTAKLTSQHGLIYSKLLKKFGPEKARLYWDVNQAALEQYRDLAQQVDFDWTPQHNYIYSVAGTEKLEAELAACEKLGIPARWESSLELPFPVTGAVCFPDQAQFHPLKLAAHIARDLQIYENTKALSFVGNRVQTPKGTVTAKKIIVATHFPMLNKHGAYFLKLYQQRSYVIALENVPAVEGMYLDCAEDGLSIRSAGQWLLLGGGGHRTGKQGLNWKLPESAAKKYYPQGKIVARWATQDCMTLDGMPYIGHYSKSAPDLYVATGFQKWGMSTSMAAAMILTDLVRGKENPYAALFSPSRSMLHGQLLCNGVESVCNLLRPTAPRCPHLGCALHWNKAERSWDCSCHGSRFDADGRVLNNPATDDLKHPPKALD